MFAPTVAPSSSNRSTKRRRISSSISAKGYVLVRVWPLAPAVRNDARASGADCLEISEKVAHDASMSRRLNDLLVRLAERYAYKIALASAIYLLSVLFGVASFDWAEAGFSLLLCYLGVTLFIQADQMRRARRAADRAADAADAAQKRY